MLTAKVTALYVTYRHIDFKLVMLIDSGRLGLMSSIEPPYPDQTVLVPLGLSGYNEAQHHLHVIL